MSHEATFSATPLTASMHEASSQVMAGRKTTARSIRLLVRTSRRRSMPALRHHAGAVIFIVVNGDELDLVDLGERLGERQLHRLEEGRAVAHRLPPGQESRNAGAMRLSRR